jgi:hypothetical protein
MTEEKYEPCKNYKTCETYPECAGCIEQKGFWKMVMRARKVKQSEFALKNVEGQK